jgi:hypothetical protein
VLDTISTTSSKAELGRCKGTYKKQVATSTEVDSLAEKFEKELFFDGLSQ